MDVESEESLRGRIRDQQQRRTLLDQQSLNAEDEVLAATERQRLRRELEALTEIADEVQTRINGAQARRELIDRDRYGVHAPNIESQPLKVMHSRRAGREEYKSSSIAYDEAVTEGDYTWEIRGLSWLGRALTQEERNCTVSPVFEVDDKDADSRYRLVFSPRAVDLDHQVDDDYECFNHEKRGTLALVRRCAHYGTNLDVRFFVRGASGEFVQWGETKRTAWVVNDGAEPTCFVTGPDLESETKGVFGLPFEELLTSEWVSGDAIVFRVAVHEIVMSNEPGAMSVHTLGQVREGPVDEPEVEVPQASMADDLLEMLDEGLFSDLAVEVAHGEAPPVRFTAHASLLAQRSAVFRAALSHEMRESETRTVQVHDVSPLAMKALLTFLYTDSFEHVERVLRQGAAEGGGAPGSSNPAEQTAQLQAVLAAAHKYQAKRLLRWCEQQLCKHLDLDSVLSLLELAHLYEASALQARCLAFMKGNQVAVVKLPDFAALSNELLVRFHLHCAGVKPAEESGRKRKRGAE